MNPTFVPGGVIGWGKPSAATIQNTRTPAGMMARIAAGRTGAYGLLTPQEGPTFFGPGTTTRGVPRNGMFYNRATMEAVGRGATARGLKMQEYLRGEEAQAVDARRTQAQALYQRLQDQWSGPLGERWKGMVLRGQGTEAVRLLEQVTRLFDVLGTAAGYGE